MKKRMLFTLGIVVTALCFGLTSCGDDDDEKDEPKNTCTCQEYDAEDGSMVANKENIDMYSYSVNSCSELEDKLNDIMNGEFYYNCY